MFPLPQEVEESTVPASLKERLARKLEAARAEIQELLARHGDRKLSEVTVAQAYHGMRDVKSLVTETSLVDPYEGIRFRGYTIGELQQRLPKAPGGEEPLPEGVFYLLLTGDLPTDEDVREISSAWRKREALPDYVARVLDQLPRDTHPMTQLSVGIMAMQRGSVFARRYREGMPRSEYWEAMLEDAMTILGRLPVLAAYIYRRTYKDGLHLPPAPKDVDWAANLAHMIGVEHEDFCECMRLYLSIHADHEGGNVSAHATHLVGSALSDAYHSLAAGMNGLAGPLHGLANQEVMRWILALKEKLGGGVPTREALAEYCWETLRRGQVIPGYGHGVLRVTDPRYLALQRFASKHMPEDENFQIVRMLYEIVPGILREHGKAKDPWPNVDAHSGVLLVHYGIVEYDFYTVFFGISRAMGVLASLVWDRGLYLPLERPKSVTTEWIKKFVES